MKPDLPEITEANRVKAREYFADLHLNCIEDAKSGKVRVNDLESYIEWEMKSYAACLAGEYDFTFTFMQYAMYLQTGVEYALLP